MLQMFIQNYLNEIKNNNILKTLCEFYVLVCSFVINIKKKL